MATPSHPPDTESDRQRARPRQPDRPSDSRVGDRVKQVASVVFGIALLVRGLRRRSLRGTVTALVGGWLLVRAVGGSARINQALRSRTAIGERTGARAGAADTPAVSRSITVGKPAAELYEAWRDPDTLSRVMGHFGEVTSSGDDRLRWTVYGPRGRDVSWETRLVEAEPGEFIRWEAPAETLVPVEGSVRFRPAAGDRGTVVTLSISVDTPAGEIGHAMLERLDIVPETVVGRALSRFKSLAESGEIPTLEANPSARGRGDRL